MSTVDAQVEMVVKREDLFRHIDAEIGRQVTLQGLADSICTTFCGPRGLAKGLVGIQLDVHRRQHIEIAKAILENIP